MSIRISLWAASACILSALSACGLVPDTGIEAFGQPCGEDLVCAAEAPVCFNGFCISHEPSGLGGPCRDERECKISTPFCVEGACATCSPTLQDCGTDRAEGLGCSKTDDCAEGLSCAPNKSCLTECGFDPFCIFQKCALTQTICVKAGSAGANERCSSTSDCEAGLVCDRLAFSLACQSAGTGDIEAPCSGTRDCLAGLTCTPAGCLGGLHPPSPFAGVHCELPPAGPSRFLFRLPDSAASFFELPFPNDLRASGAGLNLTGFPAPELEQVGGDVLQDYLALVARGHTSFGPNQPLLMRYAGTLRFQSFEALKNIYFVDLTEGESFGRKVPSIFVVQSPAGGKFICPQWLGMRPQWGAGFLPGHTYAGVIERSVTDQSDIPMAQDADFAALLAPSAPADPALAAAHASYAPLRTWVTSPATEDPPEHPSAEDLAMAAVFTVGDPTVGIEALRDAAVANPAAPGAWVRCASGVVSPCDDGKSGAEKTRGCFTEDPAFTEYQARLTLPIFQSGTAPYLEAPDGGAVNLAAPAVVRTEEVCAVLTVPKGSSPPASGWPVVVYAHGTGGSYRSHVENGLAADLSAHTLGADTVAFATLGFDQPMHANRRNSELDPGVLFYNYANARAAAGNVLQGAADLWSIDAWLAAVGTASVAGDPVHVDPAQIYLLAHSQGATTGGVAAPYDANLRGVVFSGGGGGFTLSVLAKTEPVDIAGALKVLLAEPFPLDDFHPLLALLQLQFDPVDPLNHAGAFFKNPPDGVPPKQVLVLAGVGDSFTPNTSAAALLRALRVPVLDAELLEPQLPAATLPVHANRSVAGVVVTQVGAVYTPSGGSDGHFVLFDNPQARKDALDFLADSVLHDAPTLRPE